MKVIITSLVANLYLSYDFPFVKISKTGGEVTKNISFLIYSVLVSTSTLADIINIYKEILVHVIPWSSYTFCW